MANKVSYANLKLKVDNSCSHFDFMEQDIEVLNYLPIEDKNDLISISLQKAERADGTYDLMLLDMYFHLHMVYMYTNISFTEKQKENEFKIYDALKTNEFFDKFLTTLPSQEYEECFRCLDEAMKMNLQYRNSATSLIRSIINDLPANAQAAADIVSTFDKDKYQEVINFATAANGGRNIHTNR